MRHPNTGKKFSDYFFQQQNRIVIISGIVALLAGIHLFLRSVPAAHSPGGFSFSPQGSITRIASLTQPDYLVDSTAIFPSQDQERESAFMAHPQERQWLVEWISRRYPVDSETTELFVSAAYLAAHEIGLDPHLILAVMAVESSFNPEAESPVGAQGLMQVMTKVHSKRFEPHGGIEAAKDPIANIRVGSAILKEYVSRSGSIERGLKSYVGAAAYSHDSGYGTKVLAEYQRLKQVSRGKKVPTAITLKSTSKKLVRSDTDKSRIKVVLPAKTDEDRLRT